MILEADANSGAAQAVVDYHTDFETRYFFARSANDCKKLYLSIKLAHKDQVRVSWFVWSSHIVRVFGENSRLDTIQLSGRLLIQKTYRNVDWLDICEPVHVVVLALLCVIAVLALFIHQNGTFIVQCPVALADTCGGCMDQCKSVCI